MADELPGVDGIPAEGMQLPRDPANASAGSVHVKCGTGQYVCDKGPGFSFLDAFYEKGKDASKYPYPPQSIKHAVASGADGNAVQIWAPEFGGRNGFPPPEKNELVLSIEMGCAYCACSTKNQTPRFDSANLEISDPIFYPQILEPRCRCFLRSKCPSSGLWRRTSACSTSSIPPPRRCPGPTTCLRSRGPVVA